jgi:hypothetical protein
MYLHFERQTKFVTELTTQGIERLASCQVEAVS